MKVGEGWVCWVQHVNMWQNCSLTAVQRKPAFVEESWWPEFLFSLPWHKHLPRLAQKNCCTVYSLNLIHEFTSLFSTNLLYAGLPRKAFPGKQAKVDTGHQCFSMVAQATPQDSPKASPMAIFKWKNLMEQLNPLLEWIRWMKVGGGWVCWVQLANMWQHCSVTAVQRKTAYHCVEESWWPEFNLSGSMPWCSFPWHKHLPRLAQKNCCTVYSLNLIHEFTSLFSTNLLYVGWPRKAFPGKQAKVDTGHQCFSMVAQATPQDSPKASPMAIFKWKNLMEQLNPLLEWMLNESWRRLSLLSSTCQHVAKLQFVSCAEEASLCGRVVMAWI